MTSETPGTLCREKWELYSDRGSSRKAQIQSMGSGNDRDNATDRTTAESITFKIILWKLILSN